jgi:hypothetical protein
MRENCLSVSARNSALSSSSVLTRNPMVTRSSQARGNGIVDYRNSKRLVCGQRNPQAPHTWGVNWVEGMSYRQSADRVVPRTG